MTCKKKKCSVWSKYLLGLGRKTVILLVVPFFSVTLPEYLFCCVLIA